MLPNQQDNKAVSAAQGAVSRDLICRLQSAMLEHRCDPPDPIHHFAPGVYVRELTLPAGMLVVGKIHRHNHMLVVASGKAEIVSEFGHEFVEAGYVAMSRAGVKRVVFAHEDTKFVCIHHNPENITDLDMLEFQHIEPEEFTIMLENGEVKWLG